MLSRGQGRWEQSDWSNDGTSWEKDEAPPFAADDDAFGEEDNQGWYDEDSQENASADERALASYEAPQPPMRRGMMSSALMHLAGESRNISRLDPRDTGLLLVPGKNQIRRPGSFSHAPFSPRAHRPRPFLLILFLVTLSMLAVTATAWAAIPIDTKTQV